MPSWICGKFTLPLGVKTYLMGIVNVTPDSFSGDGLDSQKAIERGLRLIEEGADILDLGGESTRPGAETISEEEELHRVMPVVEALCRRSGIIVSIDTTKAAVAQRALEAGAGIVNDVSGATFDARMLPTVANSKAGLILMHLRGTPQAMGWSLKHGGQSDVIGEIMDFWRQRIAAAGRAGIPPERIALDAGFGFGKSLEENLDILRRGRELAALGHATLSGTSRKSTIGKILDGAPVGDRLMGTAAAVALAIANGADMVRVHDVGAMRDVVRVADAVMRP